MNFLTTLVNYYQKWGIEEIVGRQARTENARLYSETFVRRSFERGYAEAIQTLKEPLDAKSRAVVDKVLERHQYIYTHNLLQYRFIFDAEENARRRMLRRVLPPLAAQMGIPPRLTEASVLYYHHGLQHTDLPTGEFIKRFTGRDIIDVGAAIGDSAYIFEKFYAPRRIHSFEPDPRRLALLRDFVARHQLEKVELIESALGPGTGHLPTGEPMRRLDDYVAEHQVEVGLIKMDVEGAEEFVLQGARETLKSQKPLLIVSIYHNGRQFFDALPLIRSIQPEYQFAIRKIDDRSPVFETTLFCW